MTPDIRINKEAAEQYGSMKGVIRVIHKGERLTMAKYAQMFKDVKV
jgi:hypothetical protein